MAAEARYTFAKETEAVDIIFVANAGLAIESVNVNGTASRWQAIPHTDHIRVTLPNGGQAEVAVTYAGTIKTPRAGLFSGYICSQSVYLLENTYWLLRPLTENRSAVRCIRFHSRSSETDGGDARVLHVGKRCRPTTRVELYSNNDKLEPGSFCGGV